MTIEIKKNNQETIIEIVGRLDTITAPALDKILTELSKQGYSFVSVDDLIYKEDFYIDHTGKQCKNA